jgi:hypothetical protein
MEDDATSPRCDPWVVFGQVRPELVDGPPLHQRIRVRHDRVPCQRDILFINDVPFLRFTMKYNSLPMTVMLPCASL